MAWGGVEEMGGDFTMSAIQIAPPNYAHCVSGEWLGYQTTTLSNHKPDGNTF